MSDTETKDDTKQYLSFCLGAEDFALEISQIREVLEVNKITPVPQTPDYMNGVINLRGSVVPVIDMRLKFGMSAIEKTVDTCIVITEVEVEGVVMFLGVLVDSVREVIEIPESSIEDPPSIGTQLKTEFIEGMANYHNEFLIILKMDRVFSTSEISTIQEIADEPVDVI